MTLVENAQGFVNSLEAAQLIRASNKNQLATYRKRGYLTALSTMPVGGLTRNRNDCWQYDYFSCAAFIAARSARKILDSRLILNVREFHKSRYQAVTFTDLARLALEPEQGLNALLRLNARGDLPVVANSFSSVNLSLACTQIMRHGIKMKEVYNEAQLLDCLRAR